MCGLCGFVLPQYSGDYQKTLTSMNDALIHRGPDGEGSYLDSARGIGLGSRRLKIIDLSENARMPMKSEDGNVIVAQNGEIYNFQDLKKQLLALGHTFISNSDTEVIVHGYEEWGTDIFSKLNGMFAICIIDKKNDRLILARDRVGVKPLYYYHDGSNFAFSSEMRSFYSLPFFIRDIDPAAVSYYITMLHVPSPMGMYKHTFKVPPANYLIYEKGKTAVVPYWEIPQVVRGNSAKRTEEDYLHEIEELIKDSIRLRMISDVPLGAFLSGGVDSSLVVAMMAQFSTQKIKTFSIGFDEKKYDESSYSLMVSKILGSEHYQLKVDSKDLLDNIEQYPEYYDEPIGDPAFLPTFVLSQFTRKHVTVALSGDGGDELFGGYPRFTSLGNIYNRYEFLLKTISPLARQGQYLFSGKMKKVFEFLSHSTLPDSFTYLMAHTSKIDARQMLSGTQPYGARINELLEECRLTEDNADKVYYLLMKTFLPDTALAKVDRTSMANSLEAREPLLDYRLLELSRSIPNGIYRQESKYYLKKILEKYVPREAIYRPKQGFGVPLEYWLRGPLKSLADKYLSKQVLSRSMMFNENEIQKLWSEHLSGKINHSMRIWNLLVFLMWHEKYC